MEHQLSDRSPANDYGVVLIADGCERMKLRQLAALHAHFDSACNPTRCRHVSYDASPGPRLFDLGVRDVGDSVHAHLHVPRTERQLAEDSQLLRGVLAANV